MNENSKRPQICNDGKKAAPMKRIFGISFFVFVFVTVQAQVEIGVFGGIANYQGDLANNLYQQSKPAAGIQVGYELSDQFLVRTGLTFAKVAGADKNGKDDYLIKNRNLSFETSLTEFSVTGEYSIFNLDNVRWTPYVFGGLALFHYNPYTFDSSNTKVYLKPLSTEGEGLAQYPNRKPYSLTQVAIPFGGGVKFAVTDNVRIGLEVGLRKLFTDYFDDVSANYIDRNDLLLARGQQAVSLAYRGNQVAGGNQNYPVKDAQRGNPKEKDWYYFTGIHIDFKLGNGGGSNRTFAHGNKRGYGCPPKPF